MKQIVFLILFGLTTAAALLAQSTNESFPTPILQNEVSGKIAARDIGDARLTHYFYVFLADNGDVNLEIETANFDGDFDLFESETLRPLAKITIAAESGASKVNRQIYFRKRAQIILRIEGKSLTDDAATYRIVFSGSFARATDLLLPSDSKEPKVAAKPNSDALAKVNSAGTIIEVLPIKKPVAKQNSTAKIKSTKEPTATKKAAPKTADPRVETAENTDKTATIPNRVKATEKASAKTNQPKSKPPTKSAKVLTARKSTTKKPVAKTVDKTAAPTLQPDPLLNIQLVILLKNGERIARPMSDVFNVSVDKGLITVITKTGQITRYNLLDVQKMIIE